MAAKGYCTVQNVAEFLGLTLTAAQVVQCQARIEQAEAFIDGECNRAWLMPAQTDEAHYWPDYQVYLRYAPVASVEAVTGRTRLGGTETTLTVNQDYEVRDLEAGLVHLVSPRRWERIMVDYTPAAGTPADIQRACMELVATWMLPSLQPGVFGLDSYSLPDLTVKFSRSHFQEVAPTVQQVIERYRFRVHS